MKNNKFAFNTKIVDDEDNETPVEVTGEFYKGTTPAGGDDPSEVFIQSVTVYNPHFKSYEDVLGDLSDRQYVYLLEEAFEVAYDGVGDSYEI